MPRARPPTTDPVFERTVRALASDRGLTQTAVASALGLSLSTFKRMLKAGNPTLQTLRRLAALFVLDLETPVQALAEGESLAESLSPEQEELLAADRACFALLGLLRQGLSLNEIQARHGLANEMLFPILRRLEAAGVLSFLPPDRVRFKVDPEFQWLPDGPLARERAPQVWLAAAEKCAKRIKAEMSAGAVPQVEGASFRIGHEQLEGFRAELRALVGSWRRRARTTRLRDRAQSGHAIFIADLSFMEVDDSWHDVWANLSHNQSTDERASNTRKRTLERPELESQRGMQESLHRRGNRSEKR